MKLNEKNIEEQILLLVDGELDEYSTKELLEYIQKYPSFKQMLDEYSSVKLTINESLIFPDKEILFRKEAPVVAFRPLSVHLKWVAAVVCFLITAFTIFLVSQPQEQNKNLAQGTGRGNIQPIATQQMETKPTEPKLAHQVLGVQKAKRTNTYVHNVNRGHRESVPHVGDHVTSVAVQAQPGLSAIAENIKAKNWSNSAILDIPVDNGNAVAEWLPIKEEHLQGISEMLAHIQGVKELVLEKATQLKNTGLVLRLGEREIAIRQ